MMWKGFGGYGPPRGAEPEPAHSEEPAGFDVIGIILRCRRTADLSQRDLAALLGVSPTTVARWETGERVPTAAALATITELAGYRLLLVDHEDQPVPPVPRDTVRDRGGRRVPVHLDVVLAQDIAWRPPAHDPGLSWGWVRQTIHTPRRPWRDYQRDRHAHTPLEEAPGCVPFHTQAGGLTRHCRDIPTPRDHAHWWALVQHRRAAHLEAQRAAHQAALQRHRDLNPPPGPEPEPEHCTCDIDCLNSPGCTTACPCQCEPALDPPGHHPGGG
ncbi:helix-turn-helix domain-containing protein [Propionibacteriaceae bacterium Y1923]